MNQEQIMQFQMLQEEANKLNEQLQMIEGNASEIRELEQGLEEIEKPATKEILANLGKKIYIPVEIKDKKLVVEIGNKKFVKKSITETIELVHEQIGKLELAREQITSRLEELQEEARALIENIEKQQSEHNHNHKKGEKCSCEEHEDADHECECEDHDCECEKE